MLENSTISITLMAVGIILCLGYIVFVLRGMWRVFEYSGFPGWLFLVPILNLAILFRIAKMSPKWLFVTLTIVLIPVIAIIWLFKFCAAFEKDSNYVLISLFLFPITIPLIGYGEKKYNLD